MGVGPVSCRSVSIARGVESSTPPAGELPGRDGEALTRRMIDLILSEVVDPEADPTRQTAGWTRSKSATVEGQAPKRGNWA